MNTSLCLFGEPSCCFFLNLLLIQKSLSGSLLSGSSQCELPACVQEAPPKKVCKDRIFIPNSLVVVFCLAPDVAPRHGCVALDLAMLATVGMPLVAPRQGCVALDLAMLA